MKKIGNKAIENSLRQGYAHVKTGDAFSLTEQSVIEAKGDEWYLDGTGVTKKHRLNSLLKPALVFAAVVMFFFGVNFYQTEVQTFATVYLDVNPSVSLSVNRKNRVTNVKAENNDGKVILAGMDLKNTDVEVAVNALIGSMIRNQYLDEAHYVLLLSVDCSSKEKGDALCRRLDRNINDYLEAFLTNGKVIDQALTINDDLEKLSAQYEVSPSKAQFISDIIEETDLEFEDLAPLSVTEIVERSSKKKAVQEEHEEEEDDLPDEDEKEEVISEMHAQKEIQNSAETREKEEEKRESYKQEKQSHEDDSDDEESDVNDEEDDEEEEDD